MTAVGLSPARRALLAAVSVNLAGVLPLFLTGALSVQIGRDFGLNPAELGVVLAGGEVAEQADHVGLALQHEHGHAHVGADPLGLGTDRRGDLFAAALGA